MSRGHGTIQRRIVDRLRSEPTRGFVTSSAITASVRAPRSAVRRALLALEKRGDIVSLPGRPRRWALVKGRGKPRARAARRNDAQAELHLRGGAVRVPRGGIIWEKKRTTGQFLD